MKRLTLRTGIVTMIAMVLLIATTTPASAAMTWADVWIQSVSVNKCANVLSADNGASLVQSTCAESGLQLWTFTPQAGGTYYTVQNISSGKCMAAVGTTNGNPIVQNTCASSTDQRWTLVGSGNQFNIRNVNSGLCLGRGGLVENSPLFQTTCPVGRLWELLF